MRARLVSSWCLLFAVSAFAEAPVSLTASDGTGLKLVKLQARGVVADPLAFTELTLTFANPLDRVLEGQFKIQLPEGASLSRFAMKIDGQWQEGEVVERQAARRAYEDFLHRRQDPALLEQSGGNEFTAKVFPIPARGVKELILSYSHELTAPGSHYVVSLAGLPEVGELDVAVTGVEGEGVLKKTHFVPSADFSAVPQVHQRGVRAGDVVVARVVPVDASEADALTDFTLLVDSSASRALGWKDQLTLVQKLLAAVPTAKVQVAAFDQDVAVVYRGVASGFGDAQLKALRDRKPLGASNVEKALQFLVSSPTPRAVVLSDGVFTAGVTDGLNLAAQVLKAKAAGVKRIDAVAVGGLRDRASLARITAGNLERDGAVLDGDAGPAEVVRRLQLSTRSKLAVKVAGATAVYPASLTGVQAGDAVLVYAQLPAGPVKGTIGTANFAFGEKDLVTVEAPLVTRAFAKAKLSGLEAALDQADGAPAREALKKEIVALSTTQRVLSSLTALLVLETEADYARFNLDRRALADILVVEKGQVRTLHHEPTAPKEKPPVVIGSASVKKPALAEKKMKADASRGAAAESGGAPADMDPASESDAVEQRPPGAPSADAPAPSPVVASPSAPPPPRPASAPRAEAMESRREARVEEERSSSDRNREEAAPKGVDPYTGQFKTIMDTLPKERAKAVSLAWGWHEEQPGDLLALVALGEVLEATGDAATAARAYGSIIDLFPARADLRRFAGVRLERLTGTGAALALDTFQQAVAQRPDHPQSHRLLAYALLRAEQPEKAFAAIEAGIRQPYPSGRFAGVDRILREDAGLIAAAWIKAEPKRAEEIRSKLKTLGVSPENAPSIRFVLNWETDANDVDFHVTDAKGNHAFYSQKTLASGGELYADVTTGYGPECFTIRLPKDKRAGPYKLQAHYYSIGPMGAGMGKLEVIEHDGQGGLRFEQRPYVVMVNQAFVDLGVVR